MNAVRKVLSVLVGVAGVLAALATFVGLWVYAIAHFVDEVQQHPVSGLSIAWCVVVAFGASVVSYLVAALFLSIAHALWPRPSWQSQRALQVRNRSVRGL